MPVCGEQAPVGLPICSGAVLHLPIAEEETFSKRSVYFS
jgi:hypothetical protein